MLSSAEVDSVTLVRPMVLEFNITAYQIPKCDCRIPRHP